MADRADLFSPFARSAGWGLALATVVASLAIPAVAHADGPSASDDQTARAAFFAGLELRDKGATAEALEKLRSEKVIKAYGVGFGLVGAILPFADRVTFVIAPDGRILSRVKSGDAAPHVEKSLAAVKAWRASARP
jgi:hypothetical protein